MDRQPPSNHSILCAVISVFAVAIFVRMPSCYESFWLDELHSGWVVWDGIDDVYPRSVIGHQSPLYFYGLWVWKQLVGESEVLLRLSSVLCVAFSCSLLTAGLARWTKSLPAGVTGGAILAMENNSLFFGTELRPYAIVVLLATIATVSFLTLWSTGARQQKPKIWATLIATTILAALCQPTSLGVMIWMPLSLCLRWIITDYRQFIRFTLKDGLSALAIGSAGGLLWQITLRESWQQKSIWATFGSVTEPNQILMIWNWIWLLCVPLAFLTSATVIRTAITHIPENPRQMRCLLALGFMAVITTSLYWVISYLELAPIWHRRYFIAVLPLLACFCGGCIGSLHQSLPTRPTTSIIAWALAFLLIFGLCLDQRTIQTLPNYPVALVVRGENWRQAIAWLEEHTTERDSVLVDAGLIEGQSWITPNLLLPVNQRRCDYLTFPARGPYDLSCALTPVGSSLKPLEEFVSKPRGSDGLTFILTRRPASQALQHKFPGRVKNFGNVTVITPPTTEI